MYHDDVYNDDGDDEIMMLLSSLAARLVYLEEIMDWSEYYTEADQSIQVFEAIINLWIQFASFEQSLNQFKKTVELYDKAIIDPIASKSCKIFKAYITFYINRNKYNNAQKIFIKSLCAGFNEEENRSLWLEYLQMMHRVNKSTVLTLPQLYHAVKSQLNEASGLQLLASLPTECHSIDNNSSTFVKTNVSISTGTTTATTTAISSSSSRSDSNVSSNRNSSINPINNNTNNSSSSDNSFIDTLSNNKGPDDVSEVIVAIKTEDITSQFVKPQTEVKVETLDKKEIFNTTTTTATMNDADVAVSATVVRNENSRIVTVPHAVVSLNHNNALIKREDRSVSPPPYMLSTTTTTSSLLPSLLSSSSSNASNVLHHIDNINDVVNHNYHDISSSNSSRDINSHIAIDSVVDTGMMISSSSSSSSSSSHCDHMIIDNVSLDESTMHAILHPTAHPSIDNSMMYASVDDLDDVTGLTPKQIIRIFYARPPMIFTAHYKEPISLGLNVLNEDKRKELERYLSIPFSRLIDYELPSTRQLSGQQQQQQQQQRSSNISINNISNVDDSKWIKVDNVLDLLESLWMIQSLKERHFDSRIRDLRVVHMTNVIHYYHHYHHH